MKQLVAITESIRQRAQKFFMQFTLDALEFKRKEVMRKFNDECHKAGNKFNLMLTDLGTDDVAVAYEAAKDQLNKSLRSERTWR